MITLAEAQAQLITVKAAISEYLVGTRRRSLKLGGKEFNREIINADIKLSDLISERVRLETIITALSPTVQVPVFRKNTSFHLNVTSKPI